MFKEGGAIFPFMGIGRAVKMHRSIVFGQVFWNSRFFQKCTMAAFSGHLILQIFLPLNGAWACT